MSLASASPCARSYDARTCLHLAASEGNLPIVELLLKMDAKVNARDRWGGTPLRDAVREGHMEVAKTLSAHGGVLDYEEEDASSKLCQVRVATYRFKSARC